MNNTVKQRALGERSRAPMITKLTLVLLFLLGLAVILMGLSGMRDYEASGFSAESSYGAIYALQKHTADAWRKPSL